MKLYVAPYAPNPRRVVMFLAEKGVRDIELAPLDLLAGEHKTDDFRRKSPLAQLPVLELDDGRALTESRAICSYLESLYPEPNLMGADPFERAEIEMWDRRVELLLALPLMLWVRLGHPVMGRLEANQSPAVSDYQRARGMEAAAWMDQRLAEFPWIAGERFTIADITACCGIDFAKMMKWRPGGDLPNLARWREAIAARPAGQVGT